MSEEKPSSTPQHRQDNHDVKKDTLPKRPRRRWARRLRVLGVVVLAMLILGGAGLGGAEYYTAQPDFCGSCHIMDPYYESWSQDVHGLKLDVKCVDCHYAPGEHHTIMAKFRGLSQAASYFSGRSGKSRPRAHVADASCLTSRCHGDGVFRNAVLTIGEPRVETRIVAGVPVEVERQPTVRFVHTKHLDVERRLAETTSALDELSKRLRQRFAVAEFERIAEASASVSPATVREARMRQLLRELGSEVQVDSALELMRLQHTRLRLAQLNGLNCAACHTYDAVGEVHFSVNQNTCFTCHFTNQAFNRETGECLKCHEPPSRMIAVHPPQADPPTSLPANTKPPANTAEGPDVRRNATLGTALMDHRDIIARGIDCASCHFDVVQGAPEVSVRDCTHCHDQERYLAEFDGRTTETVEMYHRVHVAAQHAQCTDCHRAVGHRLVDPNQNVAARVLAGRDWDSENGFLQPVLEDCQHCHPNHHREQVDLLTGTGGVGPLRPMPNAMFGSRLNCRACHSQSGTDFKGTALIEATESTCVACHSEDYRELFQQWQSELSAYVQQAEQSLSYAQEQIDARRKSGETIAARVETLVTDARHNLQLVKAGNGIHNKNYALQLLDISIQNLDEAVLLLSN